MVIVVKEKVFLRRVCLQALLNWTLYHAHFRRLTTFQKIMKDTIHDFFLYKQLVYKQLSSIRKNIKQLELTSATLKFTFTEQIKARKKSLYYQILL